METTTGPFIKGGPGELGERGSGRFFKEIRSASIRFNLLLTPFSTTDLLPGTSKSVCVAIVVVERPGDTLLILVVTGSRPISLIT